MKNLLVVFVGSGLGGAMRYLAQLFISRNYPSVFPTAILSVNIIGCFFIGVFYSLAERGNVFSADTRLFLIAGICGGFTTFSSFSIDNFLLLKSGNYLHFFLYAVGSVAIGLFATYVGIRLFKTA